MIRLITRMANNSTATAVWITTALGLKMSIAEITTKMITCTNCVAIGSPDMKMFCRMDKITSTTTHPKNLGYREK